MAAKIDSVAESVTLSDRGESAYLVDRRGVCNMKLLAPLTTLALAMTFAVVGTAQLASIDRGALVLVKDNQNRLSVKSVVAVPGDVVSISNGRVAVNGAPTSVSVNGATQWGPSQVTKGQYFAAGDPLQLTTDANAWGIIELSSVVGTVQPTNR
jgi:signal peptidase I